MTKYFEVGVELVIGVLKNGKEKKQKEVYLVDAQSVTEAEARVIKDFVAAGVTLDYKVVGAKESKIVRVIQN
jgi:hypothetical protein